MHNKTTLMIKHDKTKNKKKHDYLGISNSLIFINDKLTTLVSQFVVLVVVKRIMETCQFSYEQ